MSVSAPYWKTKTDKGLAVVVVAVFTLNGPFYPASSVHPVSVLIPYPREILILWSQTAVRHRKTIYD